MSTPLRERPDAPLGTLIFRAGRRPGEILVERNLIKEEDLTRLRAGQKGLPFVSLRERGIEPDAARLLSEDQARLFTALPIGFEEGTPIVAVADPTNDVLNRNIREALGQEARFIVVARSELNDVIGEIFGGTYEAAAAAPEPEPQPPRVDTSVPAAEPELPAAEFEAGPEPEALPEPVMEAAPELPAPAFEAPAFEAPAFEAPAFEAPAFEAPAPAPEPEPEPELAPLATEPFVPQSLPQSNGQMHEDFEDDTPPPAAAPAAAYRVSIRLTLGERMTVAECEDIGEAKGYAKALTKQLGSTDSDDWPFVNGRFLKPDTIVSVDVEEL